MPESNHTRKNSSNWKFLSGIAEGGIRFVKCRKKVNVVPSKSTG